MATSLGQYAPGFLPGEQRSLAGRSLQGQEELDTAKVTARIDARLLLPVAALPQCELSMKVAQLLGLQGPWWHQVCRDLTASTTGFMALSESFFKPLVVGNQKASLDSLSL